MQTGQPPPDKRPGPVRHAAVDLLLLFARTLVSSQTPLRGCARRTDLIDTLLDLATRHGFTWAELLREMLDTDLHGDNTRLLSQARSKRYPILNRLQSFRNRASTFGCGECFSERRTRCIPGTAAQRHNSRCAFRRTCHSLWHSFFGPTDPAQRSQQPADFRSRPSLCENALIA